MRRMSFGYHVWRPAAAKVGIPAGTGMHALRHDYASLLIRAGKSVTVVQNRLGHAKAVETLNTYSHLWPDSDDSTRAGVDAMFRAEPDALRPVRGLGGSWFVVGGSPWSVGAWW